MALETNTLVNGAWTTRTLDVNAVLRHYDQQDKEANAKAADIEKAPTLGLLTQTVIRSPLAHWILPVRLRDPLLNDVALIGDNFIQIKELRNDGHLWDVAHKENFGARIRNAKVIGSLKAYDRESNGHKVDIFGTQIKDEDDDIQMDDREEPEGAEIRRDTDLPPQCILIQLDTGDSVFLMLQQVATGGWEFISDRHRVSKSMIKLQAGTHLAVDPSSRYIAIGTSEGNFVIYALSSREELKGKYAEGSNLCYIQEERHVSLPGTIHKMEFLYPSADDDKHIILLVLLVTRGKTKMLIYEWQTGDVLRNVHAHGKGHQLEESHQMPLLVIPLTIKSSFILVSEAAMAICHNILLGSPRIWDFHSVIDPPTSFHHGLGAPLWTAWTRPIRRQDHAAEHDDLYIVREDGQINVLELSSQDDDLVKSYNAIGTFQSNCGTALASLDYHSYDAGTRGDLLLTGGDSCGGGAYLIQARSEPKFQQSIQNWSPAQDIVTTSRNQDRDPDTSSLPQKGKNFFPKPDKIFSCVGKGLKGTVVEFRRGFEAHIGLEMEFHTPIMDVWALPSILDAGQITDGSDFLLSLGDCSVHLQLAGDAAAIHETDQAFSPFDLRYRTVTASTNGAHRIQVTEKSIVFIDHLDRNLHDGDELLGIYEGTLLLGVGQEITSAVIHEALVLFIVCLGNETFLQVQEPPAKGASPGNESSNLQLGILPRTLGKFYDRVTTLTTCMVGQVSCAVVAHWTGKATILSIHPLDGANSHFIDIPVTIGDSNIELEQFVSIAASSYDARSLVLICGTSNGLVVMLQINEGNLEIMDSSYDRVGATPVVITRDEQSGLKELFFVNCDSNLYAFTTMERLRSISSIEPQRKQRTLDQIWFTDVTNPKRQQPQINSVARLPVSTSTGIIDGILVVDGSQLLVAGLGTQSVAVPRYIPIGGTPSRLLYSESLDALIVGATVNGKSTLIFLDPTTGEDISMPFDKNRNIEVEFVSGLGTDNERIYRLLEWSFIKDGTTWNFIIVCTSTGRFLMISAVQDVNGQNVTSASRPRIRYWTRYRWKCENPIYSAIGFSDGIFYCSGKTLYCETLDISEKKFKPLAQYELPSPALNLTYENGIIYALTSVHSLEVLKLVNSRPGDGTISRFIRTHGDQVTRSSLHNRLIGRTLQHPLHLISDKTCSVVGLWATHNTKADTLEEVFEAELPYSILRFRSGNCRPVWDQTWFTSSSTAYSAASSTRVLNSTGYPQIFGLAIDGSVCHFTVLDFAAWRFLRFLVNLALQSRKVCEFTYRECDTSRLQPVTEPKIMMHVDGEILKRCLEGRYLEELLSPSSSEENSQVQAAFRDLLEVMHQGNLGKTNPMRVLIDRAYEDLEFFLRPVL